MFSTGHLGVGLLVVIPLLYLLPLVLGAFALYLAVRFGVRHGIRDAGRPGALRGPQGPQEPPGR